MPYDTFRVRDVELLSPEHVSLRLAQVQITGGNSRTREGHQT